MVERIVSHLHHLFLSRAGWEEWVNCVEGYCDGAQFTVDSRP